VSDHAAEEKSLSTKMLMKLKGTFKIRLFEGCDWQRSIKVPPSSDSSVGKDTSAREAPKTAGPAESEGIAGSGAAKSVRFRKDELLKDLTAPVSTGQGSRQHAPSGTRSSGSSTSGSGRGAQSTAARGGAVKPPRSSRPLFEVWIKSCCLFVCGARSKLSPIFCSQETLDAGGAEPQKPGVKESATTAAPAAAAAVVLPRNEREMLDATFKDLFFCIRVYDNSRAGSVPVVYSLPTQRIAISALDFLVSFGKVGKRRKKVLGSWISLNR
jgi:hypothetical protein